MTINKEPVNFSPQNPCLPVGLFLSIVEHDSRGLEPKDVIKLAVSRIEKSSLKEQPIFSKLEETFCHDNLKLRLHLAQFREYMENQVILL